MFTHTHISFYTTKINLKETLLTHSFIEVKTTKSLLLGRRVSVDNNKKLPSQTYSLSRDV